MARQELWHALAPVLPDRVYAYAPSPVAAPVAPAVWIGRHDSLRWMPADCGCRSPSPPWPTAPTMPPKQWSIVSRRGCSRRSPWRPAMRWDGSTATTLDVSSDVVLRGVDVTVAVLAGAAHVLPTGPAHRPDPTNHHPNQRRPIVPGPNYFQITDGLLTFDAVDTGEVGYLPAWNAPGGGTVVDVVAADYDADAVTSAWSCQVSSAVLTPSAVTNDQTINPTFCQNQSVIPAPGISTWTLDVEIYQQIAVETGLDAFLFAHDAQELYFLIGFGGQVTTPTPAVNAPKAIGRCIGMPVAFGGAAYVPLTATFSLQVKGVPDIAYGSGAVVMAGRFTPPPSKGDRRSRPPSRGVRHDHPGRPVVGCGRRPTGPRVEGRQQSGR